MSRAKTFRFIYYVSNSSEVWQTPLFPVDSEANHSLTIVRRLNDLPPVSTIEIDPLKQKLIALTKDSKQILSRDLVHEAIQDERANMTLSDSYKAVIRSQFYRNRLFWISTNCGDAHPWEGCLFGEEIDSEKKNIHLNRFLYSGPVKEFVLMCSVNLVPFVLPPAKIGLVMGDSDARISWKVPVSLPFQAPGFAWRSLSYEYSLSSNSTAPDHNAPPGKLMSTIASANITQTDVLLKFTSPSSKDSFQNYFVAAVRTCYRGVCSPSITARNHPLNPERVRKSIILYKQTSSTTTDSSGLPQGSSALVSSRNLGNDGDGHEQKPPVQYVVFDLLGREIPKELIAKCLWVYFFIVIKKKNYR